MRTILIGDIHGCYDEFVSLLDECEFNFSKDKLIILGDFIDKGNGTFEIITKLKELDNTMKDNLVIIQGNHEYEFLYKGYNPLIKGLLFCTGRNATKKSFKRNNKKLDYYNDFLINKMVNYYEDDLFQCCHSSVINENIKDNGDYTLIINRFNTVLNKYKGKLTITGHITLDNPTYYPGDNKIEILEYNKEKELPKHGIIDIDTKCFKGNKLTAMIINKNKYILKYVDRKKD